MKARIGILKAKRKPVKAMTFVGYFVRVGEISADFYIFLTKNNHQKYAKNGTRIHVIEIDHDDFLYCYK